MIPLRFSLPILAGIVFGFIKRRRDEAALGRVGAELGTYYGTRDRDAARRERELLDLTRRLARLTWALLGATGATLLVAVVTLVGATD